MKIKLFSIVLLTTLSIVFFGKIELLLINTGFSWTFAKLFPYALLILFGIILYLLSRKAIVRKWVKYCVGFVVFVLPFGVGFIFNPIYEGDFSKQGSSMVKNSSPTDFKKDGLMVITIPGCPFCFGSIQKLKLIKKRQPALEIDFVVCTKNKEYINNYLEEIDGCFPIRMADNSDSLVSTANFRFPSFVLVKNNKPNYVWSNDQFGVRAIDELENTVTLK